MKNDYRLYSTVFLTPKYYDPGEVWLIITIESHFRQYCDIVAWSHVYKNIWFGLLHPDFCLYFQSTVPTFFPAFDHENLFCYMTASFHLREKLPASGNDFLYFFCANFSCSIDFKDIHGVALKVTLVNFVNGFITKYFVSNCTFLASDLLPLW